MNKEISLKKDGNLGFLLKSTYGINHEYELPKNFCSLFWYTLIAVLLFPISIVGHFVNIFLLRKSLRPVGAYLNFPLFLLLWLFGTVSIMNISPSFANNFYGFDGFVLISVLGLFLSLTSLFIVAILLGLFFFLLFKIVDSIHNERSLCPLVKWS